MKKYLSLILCLIMIFSIGATAFAQETAAEPATTTEATETAEAPAETDTAETTQTTSAGLIDEAYLQQIISEYVQNNGMASGTSAVSVGYCYTATGDMWFYNGDDWYYSASLYKVPVTMLLEEKEQAGEITQDTVISNEYSTGSVAEMEHKSIVYSDNYTGHAMVEYLGGSYSGKCTDQTIKFTDLAEDYFPQSFYDVSYYSAKYYTEVLKHLYDNQDTYSHVIPYMKEATTYEQQADNLYFLSRSVNYEVAQKYGSYIENQGQGDNNIHAGGIIYTPNPIIVVVMTKNQTNVDTKIGDIASLLVDYTLQLDSEVEEYQAEQARLEQEAAEQAEKEEQERIAAEEAAKAEAEKQAEQQRQNEELAQLRAQQAEKKSKITKIAVTAAVVLIALLVIFVIVVKVLPMIKGAARSKAKAKYDDDDEGDYYVSPKKSRASRHYDEEDDDDNEYFAQRSFVESRRKNTEEPEDEYETEETDEDDEDDIEEDIDDEEEPAENPIHNLFRRSAEKISKQDYSDEELESEDEDFEPEYDDELDDYEEEKAPRENPFAKLMKKKEAGTKKNDNKKGNGRSSGYVPRH